MLRPGVCTGGGGSRRDYPSRAEERVRARGFDRIALDVDVDAAGPRALYEKLGYREKGAPPRHVKGTVVLRREGRPFSMDESTVLLDMVKEL